VRPLNLSVSNAEQAEELIRLAFGLSSGHWFLETWQVKAEPWENGWLVTPSYAGPTAQVQDRRPIELIMENGRLLDIRERTPGPAEPSERRGAMTASGSPANSAGPGTIDPQLRRLASLRGDTNTIPPTLAIYRTGGMPAPGRTNIVGPQVIAAMWTDGTVVWSESRTNGGPPYRSAEIPSERLAAFLHSLEQDGVFDDPMRTRSYVGPDAGFTTIAIDDGRRQLRMRSWHEGFESRSNLVVTAQGVGVLGDRDRAQIMREQPEAYRRFRAIWSEIRGGGEALLPDAGRPVDTPADGLESDQQNL